MSASNQTEPKLQATMWAEMKPDCYGGKDCDEIEPRWHTYADGDKDASDQHEPLTLDARIFPPGTKVTIEEPHCPQCGEPRYQKFPPPKTGPLFDDKCECGFDWDEWTRNTYA